MKGCVELAGPQPELPWNWVNRTVCNECIQCVNVPLWSDVAGGVLHNILYIPEYCVCLTAKYLVHAHVCV